MKSRSASEALKHYEDREHSLVKHIILEAYLERLLMIVGQWYPKIAYIDGFAGPWKSTTAELSDTSPGIAIRTMVACQQNLQEKLGKTVRLRSVFLETDEERAALLEGHVQTAPSNIVQPEVWRKPFEAAIPDIIRWLEKDEFAFVFVDPFGWKGLIEPSVLAPFLQRPRTELLINFMWNFINLATGLEEQYPNLEAVFGKDWHNALQSAETKSRNLMKRYRQLLVDTYQGDPRYRIRTAMLPVEYVDKNKVIFFLVYVTHNSTGLVIFSEEAERVATEQKRLKLQYHLDAVAKGRGQSDLFSADAHEDAPRLPSQDIKNLWLARFPKAGSELYVDSDLMADLIEASDVPFSELLAALAELITEGSIENTAAKRLRPKFPVNYKKKEMLRRLK
jgi:three-Cys-motif partner protein